MQFSRIGFTLRNGILLGLNLLGAQLQAMRFQLLFRRIVSVGSFFCLFRLFASFGFSSSSFEKRSRGEPRLWSSLNSITSWKHHDALTSVGFVVMMLYSLVFFGNRSWNGRMTLP